MIVHTSTQTHSHRRFRSTTGTINGQTLVLINSAQSQRVHTFWPMNFRYIHTARDNLRTVSMSLCVRQSTRRVRCWWLHCDMGICAHLLLSPIIQRLPQFIYVFILLPGDYRCTFGACIPHSRMCWASYLRRVVLSLVDRVLYGYMVWYPHWLLNTD